MHRQTFNIFKQTNEFSEVTKSKRMSKSRPLIEVSAHAYLYMNIYVYLYVFMCATVSQRIVILYDTIQIALHDMIEQSITCHRNDVKCNKPDVITRKT